MGRARGAETGRRIAEEATLAAVDERLGALTDADAPLGRALDAALADRDERRPARVVLEAGARGAGRPAARDVVAAATAVDLLDIRTAVRWDGLPDGDPESTAAILVGDYLHSLAFEALLDASAAGSSALVEALSASVESLYAVESTAGPPGRTDAGVPEAARRAMLAVADAAVAALDRTG